MLDIFGINAGSLKDKKLWLIDLDGTIYKGGVLLEGTIELLNAIEKLHGRYVFMTNNSSKGTDEYIEKLNSFCIKANENNFISSTHAAILFLKERKANSLIYCQGTSSFIREVEKAGLSVTDKINENAEVVLIGYDTELTYNKILNTCRMLQKDILYVATNPDLCCPTEDGYVPDCGSICEMIKNSIGKIPIYMGKPNPLMIKMVLDKYGESKRNAVIVGDRLYTDVIAGNEAGITTVCVLSGETSLDDIIKSCTKPTYTFQSVYEIRMN